MRHLSVLILAFISVTIFAQSNDIRDRFFLGTASSFYIDFATTPLSSTRLRVGAEPDPNDPTKTIDKFADVPTQSQYISYFSFGLEPRFNIKEFSDDLAFAVSAPLTIGFGQSFAANESVNGIDGFGSVQLPVMAKLYLGTGSTYETNQEFGLNVGGGIELNKIGIINIGGSLEESNARTSWVMPVVAGGVHFWRGASPMEVNLKYGFGKKESYNYDKYGQPLTIPRITRASSIKLTFIYLLNY